MDSRTSSILINLDLNLNSKFVSNKYMDFKANIQATEKSNEKKIYNSLRQTLRESYLTGSLRYGNNFVY